MVSGRYRLGRNRIPPSPPSSLWFSPSGWRSPRKIEFAAHDARECHTDEHRIFLANAETARKGPSVSGQYHVARVLFLFSAASAILRRIRLVLESPGEPAAHKPSSVFRRHPQTRGRGLGLLLVVGSALPCHPSRVSPPVALAD